VGVFTEFRGSEALPFPLNLSACSKLVLTALLLIALLVGGRLRGLIFKYLRY
jgi:hypothetical protein